MEFIIDLWNHQHHRTRLEKREAIISKMAKNEKKQNGTSITAVSPSSTATPPSTSYGLSAQQVLAQPLAFVPAKTAETVSIKPSNYIVIGSATTTIPKTEEKPKKIAIFYDLNELESDTGSGKSKRIQKVWTKKVTTSPIGLINTGVTCFMNSAIQIMLHVPAMAHYLTDLKSGQIHNVRRNSVTSDLADVMERLNTKRREFVPSRMIKNLEKVNCMMDIWQQQDSHEYFQSLLGRLQEESTPKGEKLNTSILHDIFGGSLHQTIECGNCGNESTTFQDLYDLNVQFSSSLGKAVGEYFRDEKMDSYTCEKCKQKTHALKKSRIQQAPEYLPVSVKRFKLMGGNKYHKVKTSLSYPLDLDLTQFSFNKDPIQYRLIGVLVHSGRTTSSGHYVALCRQASGKWAEYDDEIVNKVSEQDALNQGSAYMLMYARLRMKGYKDVSSNSTNGSMNGAAHAQSPMNENNKRRRSELGPNESIDSNEPTDIDKIFGFQNKKKRKN